MGCFGSKPAVDDSHYPATQQPIYTPSNCNVTPGTNAYGYTNGQQQQQTIIGAPVTTSTTSTTPSSGRPGVHAAVLRALTDPNEAYCQIIEQLDGNRADVHALDPSGSGQTALHIAAAAGLDSIIELLLEYGAHENAIDASGDTPLHLAGKNGHLDAVKSLLQRPAGAAVINASNNENLTALVQAVFESQNVEVVQELLKRGADPNASILDDGTVLHLMTATDGFENVVREAVRYGGDLEARDANGNTPLHVAARDGRSSLLDYFLNQKPELASATNIRGQTPQQVAVENGHAESAALLAEWGLRHAAFMGDANGLLTAFSSGAARLSSPLDSASNTTMHLLAEKNHSTQLDSLLSEASRPEIDEALVCKNAQGNTALHLAAQYGSIEVVLSLAAQRCSSLQEAMKLTNADGLTPLLLAAKEGHVQVVHELLNEVPSGVYTGDEDAGNTALHFAAQEGHLPMVELLLARGADVNARNNFHQTPLHLAATWNEALVVHRLLECGADVVATDDQGFTPLELAHAQEHVELWHAMLGSQLRRAASTGDALAVMSALTSGALVDSKNNTTGDTALHVAAKNGHGPIIGILLDHTPDPAGSLGILNDAGDAPLHVAARVGETDGIRIILSVPGVDPNMTTAEGDTALHIAAGEGWIQTVEELFKGDADLNKCSEGRGSTALHDAACNCDFPMVKTLLQLGADPNAVDAFSRNNVLHQAALWGQSDGSDAITEALIAAGADQQALNCDGKTPADLARATAAVNRTESSEDALIEVEEEESQQATAPPFSPPTAMMTSIAPPPPPAAAAVASSSAWEASTIVPPVSAPTASTIAAPTIIEPASKVTDVSATSEASAPAEIHTSLSRPTGPVRAPSEVYYPNIYATDEDPSSMPPLPPMSAAPCIPVRSVRAAAGTPAPASPFAAALPISQPVINPAGLNPLSAPPRSRATTASSTYDETNEGAERRVSSSELSGAMVSKNSTSSTSILDNRLLIPYNQLKYNKTSHPALVGEGSYGKVYRGILHGNRVAIKVLVQQPEHSSGPSASTTPENATSLYLSPGMMEDFVREIDIMANLRHDNIQHLRGYCITPDGPAIVSKYYARGSMADALRQGLSNPERRAELSWTRRLHMAVDVAAGLLYMHSYKPPILHRDLKACNCFLDEHYRALVGDFGLTKPMQDRTRIAASSGVGANNPKWMAPELFTDSEMGESNYTTKSDIYAFACTMYELLTWIVPFRTYGYWEVVNRIAKGERPPIPPLDLLPGGSDNEIFVQSGGFEEYVKLMNRCWAQDPADRPEFEEVHPQLEKLLVKHVQNVRASRLSGADSGGNDSGGGGSVISRIPSTRLVNGGIGINGEIVVPQRMPLPK